MLIKKQDYKNAGVSEEILDFIEEDADGFNQHPVFQVIGKADKENKSLFVEVANALKKPAFVDFDSYQIPNQEVVDWFESKQDSSHLWNPKKVI